MTSATRTPVPLLDLEAQYLPLRDEILAAITRVCDSQRFIMGPEVEGLERELASYLEVPEAIAVSSGTDALLAAVHLTNKAHAYARTLSGGMKRRLLVAKAMVHSPPILVLDEPTAGVDIELLQQLWDYVRGLNKQGVTVVLTTDAIESANVEPNAKSRRGNGNDSQQDVNNELHPSIADRDEVVTHVGIVEENAPCQVR